MKISRSTGYALTAIGYIAAKGSGRAVLAREIADYHGLPFRYLLKVLQLLVRGGVLEGIRGPQGGFVLTRRMKDITLLDILQSVEGNLESQTRLCLSHPDENYCRAAAKAWESITHENLKHLQQITLADLVESNGE
jgi:Rrf2 family protein